MLDTVKQNHDSPFHPRDWITQAEAARIRGVTRQAIHDLVERGKLASIRVGGARLVHRRDVEAFRPGQPGRPPASPSDEAD